MATKQDTTAGESKGVNLTRPAGYKAKAEQPAPAPQTVAEHAADHGKGNRFVIVRGERGISILRVDTRGNGFKWSARPGMTKWVRAVGKVRVVDGASLLTVERVEQRATCPLTRPVYLTTPGAPRTDALRSIIAEAVAEGDALLGIGNHAASLTPEALALIED